MWHLSYSLLQAAAQVFAPFGELNPFHISQYTTPAWVSAKAGFEGRMVPIERQISQQLQEALRGSILPALATAVAQHADRASGAVMQPSQARVACVQIVMPSTLASQPTTALLSFTCLPSSFAFSKAHYCCNLSGLVDPFHMSSQYGRQQQVHYLLWQPLALGRTHETGSKR